MRYRRALHGAFWIAASIGLLLPGVSGCAIMNGFLDPTKVGQFPLEYQERGIRRILTPRDTPSGPPNASEPTPQDLVPVYSDYRLAPGDVVAVVVQDLVAPGVAEQAALEVSSTGNIRVPQLGPVKVDGLTDGELEEELKARLREAELLPMPDVRVFVQTKRGRVFTVRGAVGAPGLYPITEPDTRLLDVIGLARDISPNVPRFYVIRRSGAATEGPAADGSETEFEEAEPEGWVIPPPDEEDFQATFSTAVGLGQRQPPPADEPELDVSDLEAAIAPPQPTTGRAEIEPDAPFEPLVFDPRTGELLESDRLSEPREAEPTKPAPESVGTERFEGEPFDWEDVPELELDQRVIEIDARALFAGDPRFNIVIRDRDVISVPVDTGVYYLMGEVARPGVYGFGGRDITIKQALASSGGFSPFAWPQRCEIIRHEPGTDKQLTIPVNLDAVFAGLEDDVYLRDDDILNVGTHFVSPFLYVIRNSFRFTYGFGFVYDRNFADKDAYGAQINPETLAIQRRQQQGLPF